MRKPVIAANFKMNKTVEETVEYIENFIPMVADVEDVEVVVCTPALTLFNSVKAAKGSNISIGAQNTHWENSGAFTGENSPQTVKSLGVKHTIIGHSERREYFGETDETVNLRIKKAIENGLKVIFCIGETLEEREADKTIEKVERQIINGLKDITEKQLSEIVIAYEPIWAIGTGKTATPQQAQDVHKEIRNLVEKLYSNDASNCMRILYGGSVKPANVSELMSQNDIDGALVGGASLTPESFIKIVKY